MQVKTYGIYGLTDWQGKLKAGSIEVSVLFTGGTVSPSGAQPAYYMTKDPITQFVIENSKEYKSGFIGLVMSQELPGEHHRMAVPKGANVTETKEEEKPAETPEASASGVQTIEVADKGDAIEWLKEHNPSAGYTAAKLRSKEAFEAACQENNVKFVFA